MSTMGTGVAAGVAQAAHQAQQLSRKRDKQLRDNLRPAQRVRDTYETHLKVLEEQDDSESAPRLAVDDQMQEGSTPKPPPDDPPRPHLDVRV